MRPLTNGDLDSRPQRTARLAKSTALKRMRCLPTNLDLLGVYTSSKKPSTRTSSNGGAGSGIGALNLDLNSKSRRASNAAASLFLFLFCFSFYLIKRNKILLSLHD